MLLQIISLLYVLGAGQAVLLIIGINLKKPLYSDLKKLISLLLMTMLFAMVYYLVIIHKMERWYPFVDSIGTAAWMAIAPAFYLLNLSLKEPSWALRWRHMVWFIVPIMYGLEGFLNTLGVTWTFYGLIGDARVYLDLWMVLFFSTSFYFLLRSILLYRPVKELPIVSTQDLKIFTYVYLVILTVFAITYLFIRNQYSVWFEFTLIGLFEVFILLLSYKVFRLATVHSLFEQNKYLNKVLNDNDLALFVQQLEKVMTEEKPYLDDSLSLKKLSDVSGITSNDLSQLFSIYYKSNFYDFINRYRLEYLETLILNPENERYKIMSLAAQSGFKSKATFYKAFKQKHQLTPSQFIQRNKETRADH